MQSKKNIFFVAFAHKTKTDHLGRFFVLSMAWGLLIRTQLFVCLQTEIGCASATKVIWVLAHKGLVATHCQRQCILDPQPKNSTSFDLSNFFIHCESNGISSRFSVYLITEGVYHQPQAVFAFAMMIYNGEPLVIYNSFGIDDIHAFGVIWHNGLEISTILCYTNSRKAVGI